MPSDLQQICFQESKFSVLQVHPYRVIVVLFYLFPFIALWNPPPFFLQSPSALCIRSITYVLDSSIDSIVVVAVARLFVYFVVGLHKYATRMCRTCLPADWLSHQGMRRTGAYNNKSLRARTTLRRVVRQWGIRSLVLAEGTRGMCVQLWHACAHILELLIVDAFRWRLLCS